MRRGEWAESVPISGIECVGTIASCPGGEFPPGTPVAALMGGLGRTVPGSYAQYTVVRVSNIVALSSSPPPATTTTAGAGEGDSPEGAAKQAAAAATVPGTGLTWLALAALPESYATAWTCLFRNLELARGDRLLVRGATSSLGRAAINLAVAAGAVVTGTTRSAARFGELRALGVADAVLETEVVGGGGGRGDRFDKVLELVGNSTVVESLGLVRRGGRVCLAGWLGGLEPIREFNPLLQMASGVHLSFFGSFVFGTAEFPLSDVPFGEIVRAVAEGRFDAEPFRVFRFGEIREAHRYMEEGRARGKMVVVVDEEVGARGET